VSIVQDLQEARLTNVLTKQDLEILRAELKADISEPRATPGGRFGRTDQAPQVTVTGWETTINKIQLSRFYSSPQYV
jgi:hypothetical protein